MQLRVIPSDEIKKRSYNENKLSIFRKIVIKFSILKPAEKYIESSSEKFQSHGYYFIYKVFVFTIDTVQFNLLCLINTYFN